MLHAITETQAAAINLRAAVVRDWMRARALDQASRDSVLTPEEIINILVNLRVLFAAFENGLSTGITLQANMDVTHVTHRVRWWFVSTNFVLDRPTVAAMLRAHFRFVVQIMFGRLAVENPLNNPFVGSTYLSARAHVTDILRTSHRL